MKIDNRILNYFISLQRENGVPGHEKFCYIDFSRNRGRKYNNTEVQYQFRTNQNLTLSLFIDQVTNFKGLNLRNCYIFSLITIMQSANQHIKRVDDIY